MGVRVARVHGFEAIDFDHPDPLSLPVKSRTDLMLVVQDGHAIGVRPFRGGHTICATPHNGGSDRAFPLQQFALCSDDAIHLVLAIDGDPDFDLVVEESVLAPWDRYAVGRESLPGRAEA